MTETFLFNLCDVSERAQFQLEKIDLHLLMFHKQTLLNNVSLDGLLQQIVKCVHHNSYVHGDNYQHEHTHTH